MAGVGHASAFDALRTHQRCPKVAASMLRSADRVSRMGQYIGAFDWLLFAVFNCANVVLYVADDHPIYVVANYLPDETAAINDAPTLRVACCRTTGGRGSLITNLDRANHFVILLDSGLSRVDVPTETQDLQQWALERGLLVLETICDGNCGPDGMAIYLGKKRCVREWQVLRHELKDFYEAVAFCGRWQRAYIAAGGYEGDEFQGVVQVQRLQVLCKLGGRHRLWRGVQARRIAPAAAPVGLAATPLEPGAFVACVAAPGALALAKPATDACAPTPGQSDVADAAEHDVAGQAVADAELESDEMLRAVCWSAGIRWQEKKEKEENEKCAEATARNNHAASAGRQLLCDMNPADIALILRAYRSDQRGSTEKKKGGREKLQNELTS